jgi:cytochrome c oxidase subunit 2
VSVADPADPRKDRTTRMQLLKKLNGLWAGIGATLAAGMAAAQTAPEGLEIIGAPEPAGIGWQPAATSLAEQIHFLNGMLLYIIAAICIFVLALLVWVILRYNARSNPTPATFSHNTPIEVTWTLVPLGILVFIGAFSLPVLFNQQEIPEGDVVIKATGHQWYWSYEYPGTDIDFASYMLARDELEAHGYSQDEYLLATDTAVVVPTGQTVVMQVTASDVIHSWTIPSFGVKQDGVPGRLAELWFEVDEGNEGIYFGQCSELCGLNHSFMPITVMAVTTEEYEAWLAGGGTDFASLMDGSISGDIELAAVEN